MMDVQTTTPIAFEPVNLNELDKLAKLLATENIIVEHAQVVTASFDTEKRVLQLPMWKDLTRSLYHMLVLHEVGHALYTPADQWVAECKKNPQIQAFLNIVEDARIERMMKDKFPGSRRDFRDGYHLLNERDFFQLKKRKAGTYSLGDRLNLHFKVGHLANIPFKKIERKFIQMMEETRSFSDVIRVAEELLKYAKQQPQNSPQHGGMKAAGQGDDEEGDMPSTSVGEQDEDENGEGDKNKSDNDDEGNAASAGSSEEDSQDGDEEGDDDSGSANGNQAAEIQDNIDQLKIDTVQQLMEALESMIDKNALKVKYFEIDAAFPAYKDHIIEWKKILKICRSLGVTRGDKFVKIRRQNVNAVDYLVKEFEMRKAALQYKRAVEGKTGVINPNRLHAYKMADDIFKRQTVIADAKNHGLLMFIDFSGSMSSNMHATIEQLINLTLFCRKVNIPHRVYAFTDNSEACHMAPGGTNSYIQRTQFARNHSNQFRGDLLIPNTNMNLLELFSEKMGATDFRDMSESLLQQFTPGGASLVRIFGLNSTPLDAAALLAFPIIHEFRKETRAEIISTVFLTDGDSSGCAVVNDNNHFNQFNQLMRRQVVRNRKNGKTYVAKNDYERVTDTLMRALAEENVHVIGYRVGVSRQITNEIHRGATVQQAEDARKELRAKGCATLENFWGYEQMHFLITVDERSWARPQLDDDDDDDDDDNWDFNTFEVVQDATKGQIARAFINARNDRMNQRAVLSNFAKKIAVSH